MDRVTAQPHGWFNPPPPPDRDLWWHAQRIAAPDTLDFDQRHQRGWVRLPWSLGTDGPQAGDLVKAWVCCDPLCGGVELSSAVLEINHACCVPLRCSDADCTRTWRPARRHMVGTGTVHGQGWYHGEYTHWWEAG